MRILNYVSILLLWSSGSYVFGATFPQPFVKVSAEYSKIEESEVLTNLPKRRCQGEVPGACVGAAGAFLVDHYNCRINKTKDCASLSQDEEVSALNVLTYGRTNLGAEDRSKLPSSFKSLGFKGVGGAQTLQNAANFFKFKAESCFPLDKINNKHMTPNLSAVDLSKKIQASIANLQTVYSANKGKNETEACEACILKGLEEAFGINPSTDGLRAAMQKETFEEFVYKVLFDDGKCKELNIKPKPFVAFFPRNESEQGNVKFTDAIDKAKEVLHDDKPILLSEICTVRKADGQCIPESLHGLVVSGYKKVCKPNEPTKCRRVLRIENSWCGDWQKGFGDEAWVDAESLMANIDSNPLNVGVLSWLR